MPHFTPLDNDQARQMIDAQQLFAVYRQARADLAGDLAGSMRWREIGGARYLIKKVTGREVSLGKDGPETQATYDAFTAEKEVLRKRKASAGARLKAMDRINVAYRLGRVPDLPARIIDALDRAGLMGAGVVVVGTMALFAYEAMAAVRFETGITATQDFDLLIEARAGIQLIGADARRAAVMAALVAADRSFVSRYGEFAVNSAGFEVDFLAEDPGVSAPLSGPAAAAIAIGQSGRPVRMAVPMPSAFAAHKAWLAKEPSRNPAKRQRDADQAAAIVAAMGGYRPPAI